MALVSAGAIFLQNRRSAMGQIDLKRDYDYFTSIWEESGSNKKVHTSKAWDERAEAWGKELHKKEDFQVNMDERVQMTAKFLRSQGLLGEESQVLDIGCGPGRFVTEFAKTAGHVTGIDLSEKMVQLGQKHAEESGIKNVSFVAGDFSNLDVKELDWEKKFDLVFAAITPALGTMESLEKSMCICKGFCFHACNIRWLDDLESKIKKEILGKAEESQKNSFGKWFYSLFNMLWIKGYFPKTDYFINKKEERVKVEKDLAVYYAKTFSRDLNHSDELVIKILEYLQKIADSEGFVTRKCERWQGWILWDVRNCIPRLLEECQ